jgi:hypothetical protein
MALSALVAPVVIGPTVTDSRLARETLTVWTGGGGPKPTAFSVG